MGGQTQERSSTDLGSAATVAWNDRSPDQDTTGEAADDPFPVAGWGLYTFVRPLGCGGMGAVYEARDERLGRSVALKFIRGGDPRLTLRLMREARAQARIHHENVCQVFEVGEVRGKAYIAMELVKGASLAEAAREMSLDAKVLAIRDVARALHEAHTLGILHRDIKPSNILVELTAEGRYRPVLMDFGLAFDIASDHALTATGAMMGTPAYMSPEQARGLRGIDRRTDVYSLGATLYELLCGEPPFARESAMSIVLAVLHDEPIALRARVPAIPPDLETIAAKCLRKEPGQRYESARALAEDLDRHLRGEPILGRAEGLRRRAWRFVRRHRALVAATAVVLASLGAATVVSLRQARRADEQARRAEQRFEDVRRLANAMLFEVDGEIQHLEGATGAREVIVSRALEYLDRLALEAADEPTLALELAAAYTKIGDIQGNYQVANLGRPRDGRVSYGKARDIVDRLIAAGHDGPPLRWAQVRALGGLVAVHRMLGENDLARTLGREMLELLAALPEDASYDHVTAARVHAQLFYHELMDGDAAGAKAHADARVEATARWARGAGTSEARYWHALAGCMRGMALLHVGDPEEAVRTLSHAAAAFEALLVDEPESGRIRRQLRYAHTLAGAALAGVGDGSLWWPSVGDPTRAEAEFRAALTHAERLTVRDPGDARAARELAMTLDGLAAVVTERDPAAALALFERSRAALEEVPGAPRFQPLDRYFGDCAMALPLAKLARGDEALAAAARGAAPADAEVKSPAATLFGRMNPWMCRSFAARARQAAGDPAGAADLLERAAAGLRSVLAPRPSTLLPYVGLVDTLERLAALRPGDRCPRLAEALEVWSAWPGTPTDYTRRRAAELAAAGADCTASPAL